MLLFVSAPLLAATGGVAFQVLSGLILLCIMAGGLVISGSLWVFVLMSIGFGTNLLAIALRLHGPSTTDIALTASAWLVIASVLGYVVARLVFGPGRVNYHRVIGAVLLYLLIASVFVSIYAFAGMLEPNAFAGMVVEDRPDIAATLIYFSFVTLTSTGYGDIAPVHPIVRSLCNVETIMGQLYPATLLARLVTLELKHRHELRNERIAGKEASRTAHPGHRPRQD
ncbi:MAG: ion transporter [Rhodoplanes sp.]|nr:ion transporter [Rhodoplanes sp.]